MKKKIDIERNIKFNAYALISRAVEEGVAYGFQRSRKHTDAPSDDHIKEEIERAVMNALDEIIKFDDEE